MPDSIMAPEVPSHFLPAATFRRRFGWLIFSAWFFSPILGYCSTVLFGVFTLSQVVLLMSTPLMAGYVILWLILVMWYLPRSMRPLFVWMTRDSRGDPVAAVGAIQNFPWRFWFMFLTYLVFGPLAAAFTAQAYFDFVVTPLTLFRMELLGLIVSILIGLPIFFLIFNLFGLSLGGLELKRPILMIQTRVFLIGALVPLLIDTMLVQYYWSRTGYFTVETFGYWLLLEVIAIGGSCIFARSFGQSLSPLKRLIDTPRPLPTANLAVLQPQSTDELGLLTADYRRVLEEWHLQVEVLDLSNRLLRSAGSEAGTSEVFANVLELCRRAVAADQAFLIVFEPATETLVGVAHTGAVYRPEGYYRIQLHEPSLAVRAFTRRETVVSADAVNDPRASQGLRERFGIRSALATPLKLADEVLGVLLVAHAIDICAYGAREVAVIEVLAREAALALHSQQLRAAREQAEAEVQRHRDHLEELVRERTGELERVNRELESFSYSVAHDLRAPLRAVDGFAQMLEEDYADRFDASARDHLTRIRNGAQNMGRLIDDLLQLSRIGRVELQSTEVDLSAMARAIAEKLAMAEPARKVHVEITPGLRAYGDVRLLQIVLDNLLDNAWKYTGKTAAARIVFSEQEVDGEKVFAVRDNGAGFDMKYVDKLFGAFQRLHGTEFPGTGVGLATVQRIIRRHGGRIWAEGTPGQGAVFSFTLPAGPPPVAARS